MRRSDEHQSFAEVARLFDERKTALESFFKGQLPGRSKKEMEEIKKRLAYHMREVEYDASLALFGAVEAAFRLDFILRQRMRKWKDSRSLEARQVAKSTRSDHSRISIFKLFDLMTFDNDISVPKLTIDRLKFYFRYRNWLAHGRYWKLPLYFIKPTFIDIYQIAQITANGLRS